MPPTGQSRQCLNSIKQDILTKMHKSSTINRMADESTDIAY